MKPKRSTEARSGAHPLFGLTPTDLRIGEILAGDVRSIGHTVAAPIQVYADAGSMQEHIASLLEIGVIVKWARERAGDPVERLLRELGEMCDVAKLRCEGAPAIRVDALRSVLAAYRDEVPK